MISMDDLNDSDAKYQALEANYESACEVIKLLEQQRAIYRDLVSRCKCFTSSSTSTSLPHETVTDAAGEDKLKSEIRGLDDEIERAYHRYHMTSKTTASLTGVINQNSGRFFRIFGVVDLESIKAGHDFGILFWIFLDLRISRFNKIGFSAFDCSKKVNCLDLIT